MVQTILFNYFSRLLEILRAGTTLVTSNREAFAQACYKNLFLLCAKGGEPDGTFVLIMI